MTRIVYDTMIFLMDALTVGFLAILLGRFLGFVVIDRPWSKPRQERA